MAVTAPGGTGTFDCVIIGGGPAGLTAALYLARFRRSVLIIDHGKSRARLIPAIRNLPGFPEAISGLDFLRRLSDQLALYGVRTERQVATGLRKQGAGFAIETGAGTVSGHTVLLATGCADIRPDMDDHDNAVREGLLRYCPVCDGYEVKGLRVGLLVAPDHAQSKLQYLQDFSNRVDLHLVEPGTAVRLERRREGIGVHGKPVTWDTAYAALGAKPQSWLTEGLGVDLNDTGCVMTGAHQQTSGAGIYAIGDVVSGLDQITVALGHAALAASHIHSQL